MTAARMVVPAESVTGAALVEARAESWAVSWVVAEEALVAVAVAVKVGEAAVWKAAVAQLVGGKQ